MKRSEINAILKDAMGFFAHHGFKLPPFADWTLEDWRKLPPEARHIVDARLGWDITEFGRGDFAKAGLLLFTIRNGRLADLKAGRGMVYAEKAMIVRENQMTLMHHHFTKTEDIINRGGARLALKLFTVGPESSIDKQTPVRVMMDGVRRTLAPGTVVTLSPGESITLFPDVYHAFWGEGGDVFVCEVSTVNDDETDNAFAEPVSRFPAVEEDEEPLRLLVSDYARHIGG